MANDIYQIDKLRARAAFSRAAHTYDAAAVLQKQVRTEMLSRLDLVKIKPAVILDAGCGTGAASQALQQRFKKSKVVSLDFAHAMLQKTRKAGLLHRIRPLLGLPQQSLLCADIESLPLASSSVALVWSNLAIQWCNDLDAAFAEFHRVLQPEGLLMFSTLGPDTLRELRIATGESQATVSAGADPVTSISRFIDMHDIGDALVRAGFSAPVLDVERFTLTYDDVLGVMRDLKNIGAHNATDGRARGLHGRGFLQKLSASYEQFRLGAKADGGKLPATFEVVYGHAWRAQDKPKYDDGVSPVTFKSRAK
jgi:malonyl-CoA O-methyltransferase